MEFLTARKKYLIQSSNFFKEYVWFKKCEITKASLFSTTTSSSVTSTTKITTTFVTSTVKTTTKPQTTNQSTTLLSKTTSVTTRIQTTSKINNGKLLFLLFKQGIIFYWMKNILKLTRSEILRRIFFNIFE